MNGVTIKVRVIPDDRPSFLQEVEVDLAKVRDEYAGSPKDFIIGEGIVQAGEWQFTSDVQSVYDALDALLPKPVPQVEFSVDWVTDGVYAENARQAAEWVWTEKLRRTLPATPDDACVFGVTGPDGFTIIIDLAEEA